LIFNLYLSEEGLKKIKEELERRKSLRTEISQKIHDAKSLGDLSENAEYQEAISMQSFNEGRIQELEEMLKSAQFVEEDTNKQKVVKVGSQIKVESKYGVQEFTIVGSSESDPSQGFISNESPLGKAFLGHKEKDEVEVITPRGKARYKILKIH